MPTQPGAKVTSRRFQPDPHGETALYPVIISFELAAIIWPFCS
jgi:hypothetical protein